MPSLGVDSLPRRTAHRVIFVDLARALTVALMVQGHTLEAVLDRTYQDTLLFKLWVFQRGLTSCLFLMLSGFAFSVATGRHWNNHTRLSRASIARIRRFCFFVLLGYSLHLPASHFADFAQVPDDRWHTFLAVDVLQVIGVSLLLLQLLVLLTRTPRAFGAAVFVGCALLAVSTPRAWAIDWTPRLPLWLASYLSPGATGSLFPVIPWTSYVMLGAGLGQVYSHWGAARLATFANGLLLGAGVAMVIAANVFGSLPVAPFGPSDFWSTSPNQFLLRAGSVLVLLGLLAHLSRRLNHLPHFFAATAQESLLVYYTHLCIVYGSVWNRGLQSVFGQTLSVGRAFLLVTALVASMAVLASVWNWFKHAHHRAARLVTATVLLWFAAVFFGL
jgi:heparan-alpha-glucosaminide N-acetyltransferase-like protein